MKLASRVKRGLAAFVVFEVAVFGVSFASFCYLRRSERARESLHASYPRMLALYYRSEDLLSAGQLAGKRIQHADQKRWLNGDSVALESD